MTQVTVRQHVKERVADVLRQAGFSAPDDVVDVSYGDDIDDLFLVVISPKFAGVRPRDRRDQVWDILSRDLNPEEWGLVSLTITVSPEEVNSASIEDIKMM